MGGWSTVQTQNTIISPDVINECIQILQEFEDQFNRRITGPVSQLIFLDPVGSGTWWKDDYHNNLNKTYGDIDILVNYPTLDFNGTERENEINTVKYYNEMIFMFLDDTKFENIDIIESKKMSNDVSIKLLLILDSGEKVQVDFVNTHRQYAFWNKFRFTPIRGVKGFVLGNLYSALGETLDLSIQDRGVRVKTIDGEPVNWRKRKNTKEVLITKNPLTFLYDIGRFIWNYNDPDLVFDPYCRLYNWDGLDIENPNIIDAIEGIKLLGEIVEESGTFGCVTKYKNKEEFYTAFIENYREKMLKTKSSSKFNKAQTKEAHIAVSYIKATADKYVNITQQLFKLNVPIPA